MRYTFMQHLMALLSVTPNRENGCSPGWKNQRIPSQQVHRLTDWAGQEDLRLYRLNGTRIPDDLSYPDQNRWLAFYLYELTEGESCIMLGQLTAVMSIGEQVGKVLLLVRPPFLSEKTRLRLQNLAALPGEQVLPVILTNRQAKEIGWIVDKLESLLTCDYRFRDEYIREMVLQLVHVLLKSSGAFHG